MERTTRRGFLQGSTAMAGASGVPGLAIGFGDDAALLALAKEARRAGNEILRFVDETEQAHGPLAYERLDSYRADYTRLCDYDSRLLTALAAARPSSVVGLRAKMRVACVCDHLAETDGCTAASSGGCSMRLSSIWNGWRTDNNRKRRCARPSFDRLRTNHFFDISV